MSRTFHHGERRIRVKEVRRDQPDMKRLSRALIELAKAQAETDAQQVKSDSSRRSDSLTTKDHRNGGDDHGKDREARS
jgi:hypothetical protein